MSIPVSLRSPRALAVLDSVFLCVLIVAMCSQINLGDIGRDTTAEGYVTKQLKIALPDIALFLCFAWFLVHTTVLRAWRNLWHPPAPCWALLAALILSSLHSRPIINAVSESLAEAEGLKEMLKALVAAKESKEAIAETIQFAAYFLIAPFLFVNLMHDKRTGVLVSRRRLALWTFFAALALVAFLALWQLLKGSRAPMALFSSPNAYAGFCALALPLFLARLNSTKTSTLYAIGLSGLILLLFCVTLTSLWAILALLTAIAVAGTLLRAPLRACTILAIGGVLLVLILPRQNQLAARRAQTAQLSSATEEVKKQYIEWYVAVTRLADRREASFATGAGPGNYQFNIGSYYARLPNEEKMPPDSNNLYLVQAVSIGVLGLSALLWMIWHFSTVALAALRRFEGDWLAAGVLACLASWLFVNFFHALIVRGTGIVFAFILSLGVIALNRDREPNYPHEKVTRQRSARNQFADWLS